MREDPSVERCANQDQRRQRRKSGGSSAPHQPSTPTVSTINPRIASAFLAHLRRTGDVSVAADLTVTHRTTLYYYRDRDPEFAEGWSAAIQAHRATSQKRNLRRRVRAEEEAEL